MNKISENLMPEYKQLLQDCLLREDCREPITNDLWVNQKGSCTFTLYYANKINKILIYAYNDDRRVRIFDGEKSEILNAVAVNPSLEIKNDTDIKGKTHHSYLLAALSKYIKSNGDKWGLDPYKPSFDGRISANKNELSIRSIDKNSISYTTVYIFHFLKKAGLIKMLRRETPSVSGFTIPKNRFLWLVNGWDLDYVLYKKNKTRYKIIESSCKFETFIEYFLGGPVVEPPNSPVRVFIRYRKDLDEKKINKERD